MNPPVFIGLLIIGSQLLDGVTSVVGLIHGNIETNPLIGQSILRLIEVKGIGILLALGIGYLVWRIGARGPLVVGPIALACAVVTLIAIHNLALLWL